MDTNLILSAAWIAPMTRPPMRDAAVVFREGRIAAVGDFHSIRARYPNAQTHDCGNAVVLPGLVNAHTHLELSSIKQGDPPANFVDWIINLVSQRSAIGGADAMRIGIQQCLRFGVTTVGDITRDPESSRFELANSPLGGVSYGEVRAIGKRRGFLEPQLAAAIQPIGSMQPGISPHAPYSVENDGYRRCLGAAIEQQLPLATHLAETLDESTFLADHTGPFRELGDYFAAWDDGIPRFAGGPIRMAKTIGLLDYPSLLAHVNYCDDAELDLLSHGRASVVCCPRTHAFFGHTPHRWREMRARGINVAVGTDSCASSPDLNIVDDLRLLHRLAPEVPAIDLWQMVTTRGAAALGMKEIGSLSPGNIANAVVFPAATEAPLLEIIEHPRLPAQVWIAGRQLMVDTESAARSD